MRRFEELTTPHIGVLYRMAFHLSGNKEDAEDLVQDVFIKAQRSFHTLRDNGKCKSWLCSILYRQFVDGYRKRRYFAELKDVPAPVVEEESSVWPEQITPKDLLYSMENLDPKYRAPLVAYFLSGLSYKEIAESLAMPIGTVMSRIHRAKKLLRVSLSELRDQKANKPLRIVKGGLHGM
jgi:RNA polymerase sigma-70 factor (ECF subfamily)